MKTDCAARTLVLFIALALPAAVCPAAPEADAAMTNIFSMIRVRAVLARGAVGTQQLSAQGRYADAETLSRKLIELAPRDATAHYNLACALANQDRADEALDALGRAVDMGFRNAAHIRADPDLASLRGKPRFRAIVARAPRAVGPPTRWERPAVPAMPTNGVGWIATQNTSWDRRLGLFRTCFRFPEKPESALVVDSIEQEADVLLRQWAAEGTAAGNWGDLYDNRDRDHANMSFERFPQLTRLEYSEQAKEAGLDNGRQGAFLFNRPTIGNSSTALTKGPYWRSQARAAMGGAAAARELYLQYTNNHCYFYPEHRDHDPAGDGKGHGDVYPANTPYMIVSQGSSGADRPFMDAVACILAAFRPDVKSFLAERGALMPTVQMVFRNSSKLVTGPEVYLTGIAHPSVFEGANIDLRRMVELAHSIRRQDVPPLVRLRVVAEETATPGVDFFDPALQLLFNTPCAIARVHRTVKRTRRLTVSAEDSVDLNGRRLTWMWMLLRGDPAAVRITPVGRSRSSATIEIAHQEPRPIVSRPDVTSPRVDIGVFAFNGKRYSAPAFVTTFFLPNEKRTYAKDGRILEMDYAARKDVYVDPGLTTRKDWRDVYEYTPDGELLGWTRHRGDEATPMTRHGAVVLTRDDLGRPVTALKALYGTDRSDTQASELKQVEGKVVFRYTYTSPDDRLGEVEQQPEAAE